MDEVYRWWEGGRGLGWVLGFVGTGGKPADNCKLTKAKVSVLCLLSQFMIFINVITIAIDGN